MSFFSTSLNDFATFSQVAKAQLGVKGYRAWCTIAHPSQSNKRLLFRSQNIGSDKALKIYRQTIKNPPPHQVFCRIGEKHNLHVTKKVTFNPIGRGCCIGMTIEFIKRYQDALRPKEIERIQKLGPNFSKGASPTAVALQNISHQFVAAFARPHPLLLQYSKLIFHNSSKTNPQHPFLKHVQSYCCYHLGKINFREFMLTKLKEDKIPINRTLYATILDVENAYRMLSDPNTHPYEQLLSDTKKEVAELLGIQLIEHEVYRGVRRRLVKKLFQLDKGLYLIAVLEHVMAWITISEKCHILFDPAYGCFKLEEFSVKEQKALESLLSRWLKADKRQHMEVFKAFQLAMGKTN